MPDTGASHIVSLDVPSVLDLRKGPLEAVFAATVQDPDGVRQVVVHYDRPLATTSGVYGFQIIHGYGDDWSDGQHDYATTVLPHNIAGTLNITHVDITDNLGNRTTVTGQMLRDVGVDTSITVRSDDPDTTAPELTELVLPKTLDLTKGNALADFAAAASDQNEIDDVVIWFDRDLGYSFWTGDNPTFHEYSLIGLFGYGDDWSDGASSDQFLFSGANTAGMVDVDRVEVTDVYGNSRVYSNAELRGLGFDTSFWVEGSAPPVTATYVDDLPRVIKIREGQSLDVALEFVGMTNEWVGYEYSVSTAGGTASLTDIGSLAGSGSVYGASTSPTTRSVAIPLSAIRDDFAEPVETAYLTIRLTGNMTFADGGSLRVVQINILDDNRTTGSGGNDRLHGTSAPEVLTGGRGNDLYYLTPGDKVVEYAGEGNDTVSAGFSHTLAANVENLVLTGSADITGQGNALANTLTGNAGDNFLNGRAGADRMIGGAGDDIYVVDNTGDRVVEAANGGIDTVRTASSHKLAANVENLVLTGSAHATGSGNVLANNLSGNAGNNILRGGEGNDVLSGKNGNDALYGGADNDRLWGGSGSDRLFAGSGRDLLDGGAGADTLDGGTDNDTLRGGDQDDRLLGGSGADLLSGGTGADRLIGGTGRDRLTGGIGADQFIFTNRLDSTATASGRDIITDFSRSQGDKIDLSALDANLNRTGNQSFDFIGTERFSGTAGELRHVLINGTTVILADLDGDMRADFSIGLSQQITLNADDFFL